MASSGNNNSGSAATVKTNITKSSNESSSDNGKKKFTGGNFIKIFIIFVLVISCLNLFIHPIINDIHIDSSGDHHKDNPKSPIAMSMSDFKMNKDIIQTKLGIMTTENNYDSNHQKKEEDQPGKASQPANKIISDDNESDNSNNAGISVGKNSNNNNNNNNNHELQCEKYGGPSNDISKEMIYWEDIPSDSTYVSPFHVKKGQQHNKRYMTFEPDGGGWNNIRMSMETVFSLAHATGRTLVLPPEQRMYLLGKNNNKQKNDFTFTDFFPVDELSKEHVGLDIITMEEFLLREGMAGNLIDKTTGKISYPPNNNQTNWNGSNGKQITILKEWLRTVSYVPLWRPGQCMAAFPSSEHNHDDIVTLENLIKHPSSNMKIYKKGEPVPVNSSSIDERLHEVIQGRKKLCIYDEKMQNEMLIHFKCHHKSDGGPVRLLTHFYNFLFFEDYKQDLWNKRFIRDHVRYIDEIQCAAARVVHSIRQHVINRSNDGKGGGNKQGIFDTMHIRRGDFQYKKTRISCDEIDKSTSSKLKLGDTIYIATDERDKHFFNCLKNKYDILFLDDFLDDIGKSINTNYYGMLDQLISSKGRIFYGCWFSTFTGYIMRIRGYHSIKNKYDGYQLGILPNSFYYTTPDHHDDMLSYTVGNTFAREFPNSWRDINYGIF